MFRAYFLGVKIQEPVAGYAPRVPASPEVVALANELVRKFSECFWFWHPEARVRYEDDARLVVEHLREYGDKRAWAAARELQRCLQPLSRSKSSPCWWAIAPRQAISPIASC